MPTGNAGRCNRDRGTEWPGKSSSGTRFCATSFRRCSPGRGRRRGKPRWSPTTWSRPTCAATIRTASACRRATSTPSWRRPHAQRARRRSVADSGALLTLDGAQGYGQVIGARGDGARHRAREGARRLRRRPAPIAPSRPDRPLGRAVHRRRPGLDPLRQRAVAADRRAVRRPRCAPRHQPVLRRHPARRRASRSCSTSPPARSPGQDAGRLQQGRRARARHAHRRPTASRRRTRATPCRAARRAAALRRAQGLGPGADLRAARRRARRRPDASGPKTRAAVLNSMFSVIVCRTGSAPPSTFARERPSSTGTRPRRPRARRRRAACWSRASPSARGK